MEGWEESAKTTAGNVMRKRLIVCNGAVMYYDEEIRWAIRISREAHARSTSSKTTVGWEEYAEFRKEAEKMQRRRKGNM